MPERVVELLEAVEVEQPEQVGRRLASRFGAKRTVRSPTSARRLGSPVSASGQRLDLAPFASRLFSRTTVRRSCVRRPTGGRQREGAEQHSQTTTEPVRHLGLGVSCAGGVVAARNSEQAHDPGGAAAGLRREPVGCGPVPLAPGAAAVDLLERGVVRAEQAADVLQRRWRRFRSRSAASLRLIVAISGVHLVSCKHPRPAALARWRERVWTGARCGSTLLGQGELRLRARRRTSSEVQDRADGGDRQHQGPRRARSSCRASSLVIVAPQGPLRAPGGAPRQQSRGPRRRPRPPWGSDRGRRSRSPSPWPGGARREARRSRAGGSAIASWSQM